MKVQTLFVAIAGSLLAACSNAPSTSEIKDAVMTHFGGGCNLIAVDDIEKVNGAESGDTAYKVSVKYTLKIKSPKDAENTFNTKLAEIDQRLLQAKQEADTLGKWVSDVQPILFSGSDPKISAAYPINYKKAEAARAVVANIQDERAKALLEPLNTFVTECAGIDNELMGIIDNSAKEFDSANAGKDAYLVGFTLPITGTIDLVKTDNGWKTGL